MSNTVKILIGVVVVALIAVGGVFYSSGGDLQGMAFNKKLVKTTPMGTVAESVTSVEETAKKMASECKDEVLYDSTNPSKGKYPSVGELIKGLNADSSFSKNPKAWDCAYVLSGYDGHSVRFGRNSTLSGIEGDKLISIEDQTDDKSIRLTFNALDPKLPVIQLDFASNNGKDGLDYFGWGWGYFTTGDGVFERVSKDTNSYPGWWKK